MDYYLNNADLREYYLSLPSDIQQRLLESGVEISTLGELKQVTAHWMA